jgi:hypothetical protein
MFQLPFAGCSFDVKPDEDDLIGIQEENGWLWTINSDEPTLSPLRENLPLKNIWISFKYAGRVITSTGIPEQQPDDNMGGGVVELDREQFDGDAAPPIYKGEVIDFDDDEEPEPERGFFPPDGKPRGFKQWPPAPESN